MTAIYSHLILKDLDNRRFSQLESPFVFTSDVLARMGVKFPTVIPVGFVQDRESIPLVRGSNNRGGVVHDYLCRKDSIPVVTKAVAAEVYLEIMRYCYDLDTKKGWLQTRRERARALIKWAVVRVAWGYFHKHFVLDTPEDIADCKGDPFVK